MAGYFPLVALIVLVGAASAAPIRPQVELPPTLAQEWQVEGPAGRSERLQLSFAMRMAGHDVLAAKVASVSDPQSPQYGQYWTREELHAAVYPEPAAVAAVMQWLAHEGVQDASVVRGYARAEVPVATAEALLGVSFFSFKHISQGVTIVRTLQTPTLPPAVAAFVEFVGGIHSFPVVFQPKAEIYIIPPITPAKLREMYGVSDVASGKTTASQALAEFQGQGLSAGDLAHFQSKYKLPPQPVKNTTETSMAGHIESNLDVQYIMVTGEGIPTDFYLSKGMSFDLIGWVTAVQAHLEGDVWSVSYGEDIAQVTVDYAQRLSSDFEQLAALGVTVVFASGDSGVYSRTGGTDTFHPSFPASLPTVTAVGATVLDKDAVERRVVQFSGGGFCHANYFPRPSYQDAAVATFFSTYNASMLPDAAKYDAKGRGFPDVSAVGTNYKVVVDRVTMSVSGTSASAPAFAGIVALLNDQRALVGKPKFGFINPWLYQHGDAFNDITAGCNDNNVKATGTHVNGFCAIKGWDPASGLGTPNYPKLKAAALA